MLIIIERKNESGWNEIERGDAVDFAAVPSMTFAVAEYHGGGNYRAKLGERIGTGSERRRAGEKLYRLETEWLD